MYEIYTAAIYVLYNPNYERLTKSLKTTSKYVNRIYLVDNTDDGSVKKQLLCGISDKVVYMPMHSNVGIAKALNCGCQRAKNDGCSWCLLLDQDSVLTSNFVESYSNYVSKNNEKIGILCPQYTNAYDDEAMIINTTDEIFAAITSGSFVNLQALEEIGGFNEDLFIDAVDTEYSWRLILKKYKIIRLNWLLLRHEIGTAPYDIKIFGRRILTVDNHNYIRCYYIVRNNCYINRIYRKELPFLTSKNKKMLKYIIKVIFLEADKVRKLKAILWGWYDAKTRKLGKFEHNI